MARVSSWQSLFADSTRPEGVICRHSLKRTPMTPTRSGVCRVRVHIRDDPICNVRGGRSSWGRGRRAYAKAQNHKATNSRTPAPIVPESRLG
jgi:hypothetical protein